MVWHGMILYQVQDLEILSETVTVNPSLGGYIIIESSYILHIDISEWLANMDKDLVNVSSNTFQGLYISGLGEQTARLAGEEGDGFVTNELNIEVIRNKLSPAVAKGARE